VKEEHIRWHTPYLGGRVFEMLVFGHAGLPVILFPTSQGRFYEYKDFRLVEAAGPLLDAGRVKLYCPDGIDGDSWYNQGIHPADRVRTHMAYRPRQDAHGLRERDRARGGTCFRATFPRCEGRDRS
jgi:esterase/lipase superfamily enzyme